MVYPHNVYYLAIKRNELLIDAIWNNLEDSQRPYVEWKMLFLKDYILYDSIHMLFSKRYNCSDREQTGSCQR